MNKADKARHTIRICRYQVIIGVICGLIFTAASMFSSHEKQWYPYTAALTFDDGPHPEYTQKLMDILEEEGVPATFFFVGKQIHKHPEIAASAAARGFELANHTYNHYKMTTLAPHSISDELEQTRIEIIRSGGTANRWFRPPGGNFNETVFKTAESDGFTMVLWDIETRDITAHNSREVYTAVMNNVTDKNIILLHSGVDATLECLPRIIKDLQLKGYRFLTVSEMLALREKTIYARF